MYYIVLYAIEKIRFLSYYSLKTSAYTRSGLTTRFKLAFGEKVVL